MIAGKVVTVTGAGGSIGSEVCSQILSLKPAELRLISRSEQPLYEISRRLNAEKITFGAFNTNLIPILADASDLDAMFDNVYGTDVLIHAAAHKHVPICEKSPLEAIANNVGATYALARAAHMHKVPDFVYISSDKAVAPVGIMGLTKRLGEKIVRDLYPVTNTHFRVVRFGNVMHSSGSVFPLWQEQIRNGGPLTITDPDCARYFMTIPNAVELVISVLLETGFLGYPYVFEMGKPYRMGDLALQLMNELGKHVEVKVVGMRPGEKMHEQLTHSDAQRAKCIHPKIYQVIEERGYVITHDDISRLQTAVRNRDRCEATYILQELAK